MITNLPVNPFHSRHPSDLNGSFFYSSAPFFYSSPTFPLYLSDQTSSYGSSLLCPPLIPLFSLLPSINPDLPRGNPLRAAALRVFRTSVDIGQHVRQISPSENHKTNGIPGPLCSGTLQVWLCCGQRFSTGDVLLQENTDG